MLTKRPGKVAFLQLNRQLDLVEEIASFKGLGGSILYAGNGNFLVSVDDQLLFINHGYPNVVLKAPRPENVFWHFAEGHGKLFVQEYGKSPTGIYQSDDFEHWEKLIANTELDKFSKHFHYVAYDKFRDWLIVTLGDGCNTRASVSTDLGKSWRPLYKGPWQFVPIEVLPNKLVFGMDSGITQGGVGIYRPDSSEWDFIFLKYCFKSKNLAQMCDLKFLDNGYWMAGLGCTQIIVSKDLFDWYAVYADEFTKCFNRQVSVIEGKDFVICSGGKTLLLVEKNELPKFIAEAQCFISSCKTYSNRFKGLGFNLKQQIKQLIR